MADSYSDYSKIEDLLESKRLYTELQDKFKFEVDSREARIFELQNELREQEGRVENAFTQIDKLIKEREQMLADRDKMRDQYEKKVYQMRKQFEDRLRQGK